jgi:hypothetical protein
MNDIPQSTPGTETSIATATESGRAAGATETAADVAKAEAAATTAEVAAQVLPFNAEPIALDTIALHDGLTEVQSRGGAATRISGEHVSGLLYDQGTIDAHRAPYGMRYAPNFAGGTRAEPEAK